MAETSLLSHLDLKWFDGALPGTQEAVVPERFDPFEIARHLRESDPSAAYACIERKTDVGDMWFIVAMPDEPPAPPAPKPAQISEPVSVVYKTRVCVFPKIVPRARQEFFMYGPSTLYIDMICRRLANVAPAVISVTHDRPTPILADNEDGELAAWVPDDEAMNQEHCIVAIGNVCNYLRRVYPRDVPTNEELARELAKVFRG